MVDSGLKAGGWDGEMHYWPEVRGFDLSPLARYSHEVPEVQYVSQHYQVKVEFKFRGHPEPAQAVVTSLSKSYRDTCRVPDGVEGILADAVRFGKNRQEEFQRVLGGFDFKDWDCRATGWNLECTWTGNDRDTADDSALAVTFEDIDRVIWGGESGVAEVSYYDGASGKTQRAALKWTHRAKPDVKALELADIMDQEIHDVLLRAELYWGAWHNKPRGLNASRVVLRFLEG